MTAIDCYDSLDFIAVWICHSKIPVSTFSRIYLALPLCTRHCEGQAQSIFVSELCMNKRICSCIQFLFAFSHKSPTVREPRASARRTHEVPTIPLVFIAVHTIRLLALETFRFLIHRREVRCIIHYLFPRFSFVLDKSQTVQDQGNCVHSHYTRVYVCLHRSRIYSCSYFTFLHSDHPAEEVIVHPLVRRIPCVFRVF